MSTSMRAFVDTSKVANHRRLRFASPAEMHADVAALVEADQRGTITQLGNWTVGQTLGHLGLWAGFAHEGTPLKPPFFVKWIMKGRKQKYLEQGLPRGVRIPKVDGGTLGIEALATDEGLRRFVAAWARLEAEAPVKPNVIFGPLTHGEWIQLNLRHAELHLGFLKVQER